MNNFTSTASLAKLQPRVAVMSSWFTVFDGAKSFLHTYIRSWLWQQIGVCWKTCRLWKCKTIYSLLCTIWVVGEFL